MKNAALFVSVFFSFFFFFARCVQLRMEQGGYRMIGKSILLLIEHAFFCIVRRIDPSPPCQPEHFLGPVRVRWVGGRMGWTWSTKTKAKRFARAGPRQFILFIFQLVKKKQNGNHQLRPQMIVARIEPGYSFSTVKKKKTQVLQIVACGREPGNITDHAGGETSSPVKTGQPTVFEALAHGAMSSFLCLVRTREPDR
jgi:hypothetical protein